MAEKFSLYAIPVADVLALYLVFGFECKMYGRRKLNDDKMTNTWSVPTKRNNLMPALRPGPGAMSVCLLYPCLVMPFPASHSRKQVQYF